MEGGSLTRCGVGAWWGWWLCVGVVGLGSLHVLHAECPHEPTGGAVLRRWSQASSWPDGQKPSEGSAVVIDDDVLLDESTPALASLTISDTGSLVFSPEGDFTLTTNYVMLHGALHIGSEDCLFTARARIVLTGNRGEYNIEGYGEKFLAVQRGATLELHGQNKLSWTKLDSTVPKVDTGSGLLYSKRADNQVSDYTRGMVMFVANSTTGEVRYAKTLTLLQGSSYRMSVDPPELLRELDAVKDGEALVLAVQWNLIGDEVDMGPVYDAIERAAYGRVTNASSVRQVQPYDAWVMVAVRGQFVKEKLGQRLRRDNTKEASLTVEFPEAEVVVSVVSNTKPINDNRGYTDVFLATKEAGARVIDLADDATTWQPGDTLLLTSTDFDYRQAETAQVIYCPPDQCANTQTKVLMVNRYMHYGEITAGVDQRAEVALLSRNIVIEGRVQDECPDVNGNCDNYPQDTFGGHITIEEGFSSVRIEGVELRDMGQLMESNRHPLFFRQCGAVDNGTNTYVRSSAIVNSFSNCVVLSGTHGLVIQDNVAYEHYGSCYYLKEGGETRTLLDGNLGASTLRTDHYLPLDKTATTFLISNPLTYFRNNVAAGGDRRGIWYLFPVEPVGESSGKGIMQRGEARRTAYTQFSNNAAHSYWEFGLFIDNRLNAQGDNAESSNSYKPLVDPLDTDSGDKATVLARLTAFKNRYYNAFIRGGYFRVQDSSFADSRYSLQFGWSSDQFQFLENSVVVGESDNIGEPTVQWDSTHKINIHYNRSLPIYWHPQQPIAGFLSQDGPHYLDNVRFHNFRPNDNRTAQALSFPGNSYWMSSPVNQVERLTFSFDDGQDTGLRTFFGDPTDYGYGERDGDLQVTLRDKDGSLTGSAGATVVKPYPVYVTEQCYYREDWKMSVCPHKYGKLDLHMNEGRRGVSRPILTRDDLDPLTQSLDLPNIYRARFPVILGGSHSYVLHWSDIFPTNTMFYGLGFEKDYGVRIGMCVPRDAELDIFSHTPTWLPRMDRWTQVDTLESVDRNKEGGVYFWDRDNGVIFFKVVSHRTRCPDTYRECKSGCPFLKVTLLSGNQSDADCRDRISAYSREPISSDGALTYQPLPASATDEELGAGSQVPFSDRPAVDGGYGQWSSWGPCTVTCGGGTQIRTRPCDSPMPQNGGQSCVGPREDTQICGTTPCEIDGGFGSWSEWSTCTAIEDNENSGQQIRTRDCDDPAPLYNGVVCSGSLEQMQGCTVVSSA